MASSELDKTINQLMDVKTSRRQVLKWGGITALTGATCVTGVAGLMASVFQSRQIEEELDQRYPVSKEMEKDAQNHKALKSQVIDLLVQDRPDEASQLMKSEEFAVAQYGYFQKEAQQETRIKKSWEELKTRKGLLPNDPALNVILAVGSALWFPFMLTILCKRKDALEEAKENSRTRIAALRPEWLTTTPTSGEVIVFDRAVSYLTPTGGKIPVTEKGKNYNSILPPTYSAEEQVDQVIKRRRNGELGKYYIHQLSVQGRLPDRFKYAAIALILDSRIENNWKEPYFAAEWGKIGPLVHDGGNVNTGLNPLWKTVDGRTDFLQRVFVVQEPELGELEKQSMEERKKLPLERQIAARQD